MEEQCRKFNCFVQNRLEIWQQETSVFLPDRFSEVCRNQSAFEMPYCKTKIFGVLFGLSGTNLWNKCSLFLDGSSKERKGCSSFGFHFFCILYVGMFVTSGSLAGTCRSLVRILQSVPECPQNMATFDKLNSCRNCITICSLVSFIFWCNKQNAATSCGKKTVCEGVQFPEFVRNGGGARVNPIPTCHRSGSFHVIVCHNSLEKWQLWQDLLILTWFRAQWTQLCDVWYFSRSRPARLSHSRGFFSCRDLKTPFCCLLDVIFN